MTTNIYIFRSKSDKIKSFLEFRKDLKQTNKDLLINLDFNYNDIELPF